MIDLPKVVPMVADIVGILAIGIGGWWTWQLFIRQRAGHPRARLSQTVEHVELGERTFLVRVCLSVENVGTVAIEPRTSSTTIQRILPTRSETIADLEEGRPDRGAADDTLEWDSVAERVQDLAEDDFFLEPGEKEQLWIDFVLRGRYRLIQAHTMVDCGPKYKGRYWDAATLHWLEPPLPEARPSERARSLRDG